MNGRHGRPRNGRNLFFTRRATKDSEGERREVGIYRRGTMDTEVCRNGGDSLMTAGSKLGMK